ncbi:MAG: trimethylamine methyltransferase family protein [Desulfobacterales bacterium]|nr:trimethylamine methyltransferase family protein [Desulfobacterales bacterium]
MNRATDWLNQAVLENIHEKSLDILATLGVSYHSQEALDIFKKHGFKMDGNVVFFTEEQMTAALKTVPSSFTLSARNPENDIILGDGNFVLAPGYGPSSMMDNDGNVRDAVMEDFESLCKLVQTSEAIDLNSAIVVQPNDLPAETSHINMIATSILLTDKPLMCSTVSEKAVQDSLALARYVWGDDFGGKTVMLGLVDGLDPMAYSEESCQALIRQADAKQATIIHSGGIWGVTSPISVLGTLATSNAINLAGIVLTQLVNPGTPVVYGMGGSPMNFRNGEYTNASVYDIRSTAIAPKVAGFYNIPCRTHTSLTDSYAVDYQAGMESGAMVLSAAYGGSSIGMHACGTLGAMTSMNFAKFILDEQSCLTAKRSIEQVRMEEDAWYTELVKEMGHKANYMVHPETAKHCRDFFSPAIFTKENHAKWLKRDDRDIVVRAHAAYEERIREYQQPEIDPDVKRSVEAYVAQNTK